MVNHIIRLDDFDSKKKAILNIQDSYRDDTKDFIAFLDNNGLTLNLDGLLAYNKYLSNKPAGTQNKRLSAAKNRMRFLFYRSVDAIDTAKTYRFEEVLKNIKGKKKQSRAVDKDALPDPEKIWKLISEIRKSVEGKRTLAQRLPLFIEFMLLTGCRVGELAGIKLSDLKDREEYVRIRIRRGKGNKERFIYTYSDLLQRIHSVFQGREYLFETSFGRPYRREYISNQIKKAGIRILGISISAHTLRHVFATTALKAGWSPRKLAEQLGHSSTAITLDMYVHDSPTWQDIKNLWKEEIDVREADW